MSADETFDIYGTEQFPVGVRYLGCDQENKKIIILKNWDVINARDKLN